MSMYPQSEQMESAVDCNSATDNLGREIARLKDAIELLERRLEPVLEPLGPEVDTMLEARPVLSPLAERVSDLAYTIGRLDKVIRRIEA